MGISSGGEDGRRLVFPWSIGRFRAVLVYDLMFRCSWAKRSFSAMKQYRGGSMLVKCRALECNVQCTLLGISRVLSRFEAYPVLAFLVSKGWGRERFKGYCTARLK